MKQQILVPNMVYKFMEPKYLKKFKMIRKFLLIFLVIIQLINMGMPLVMTMKVSLISVLKLITTY